MKMKKFEEDSLNNSCKRLELLIKNIPDIIMEVTRDGTIQFINRTLPGFSVNKTIGKKLFDFIPQGYHKKLKSLIKYAFKTGRATSYKTAGAGSNNSIVFYETKISPIKHNGKVITLIHSAREITKQKKIEEDLKESEARYRSFIDVTGQLGWTTDTKGLVKEDIPSWRKFTGQSHNEVKGYGWTKAIHPDDVKHTEQVWEKAVKTKGTYEVEYRVRRHDGVYRWFLTRGIPVLKNNKSIQEWVGTCMDITEKKKAEQELKESEEKFRNFFDSSNDAIFVADIKTKRLVDCNKKAEVLLGFSKKKILTMRAENIHPKDKIKETMEGFKKQIEGKIDVLETEVLTKSGKRIPVSINASAIEFNGKNYLLGIFREITERKKAEQELLRKNKELEEFNQFSVDREIKMIELKKEIKALLKELGRSPEYNSGK